SDLSAALSTCILTASRSLGMRTSRTGFMAAYPIRIAQRKNPLSACRSWRRVTSRTLCSVIRTALHRSISRAVTWATMSPSKAASSDVKLTAIRRAVDERSRCSARHAVRYSCAASLNFLALSRRLGERPSTIARRCSVSMSRAAVALRLVAAKPLAPEYSRPSNVNRQLHFPARARSAIAFSSFGFEQPLLKPLGRVQYCPTVGLQVARADSARAPMRERLDAGADNPRGLGWGENGHRRC